MKTTIQKLILSLVWLGLPLLAQAQFNYTTNNGAITITGYNTAAGFNVVIPATINDFPVTTIGDGAFYLCYGLTSVTIPNNVTSIGASTFAYCYNLASVTIGNSVTNLGDEAFYSTSLTNMI